MVDRFAPFEDQPSEPIVGTKYRVNKLLADRVNKLIADAPPQIQGDLRHAISSGYRTYEQQTKAYLHHLAGGGMAARPGHSAHERMNGMAVDWNNITPRAWAYLKTTAPNYKLGFPFGSPDPFHMQPVETYANGVNLLGLQRETNSRAPNRAAPAGGTHPIPAAPVPLAYDEIFPRQSGPALPIEPITSVSSPSQEPRQIITKPMPIAEEPLRHIAGPRGAIHQPDMGGAFRQAISSILRTR
jgi:hypothetical protein